MKKELLKIVIEAGEILKEGFYKSQKGVKFKGKKDLVTKYDVGIEEFLKEKFAKKFKNYNVIAEESDNTKQKFNNSIIIDPIDGTTNFVNKVPHCAISVGVYKDKKPYIGVVYNPILNELYYAKVGSGAYLNGKRIEVSKENELMTSLLASGFPYTSGSSNDDLEDVMKKMKAILPFCQDIRRLGSAALDLCYVASGVYEGYYEMNLKPWDMAAGIIILTEAGGRVSDEKGEKHKLFKSKYIVASNKIIHKEFIKKLND